MLLRPFPRVMHLYRMAGFAAAVLPDEVTLGVVEGDPVAIARAYETLCQPVMNLAARILQDRGAAEEVVQDTFVELLEKATSIRERGAVKAWVRTVAVNHCLMRLRSPWTSRRMAGETDYLLETQQLDEAPVAVEQAMMLPTLEHALASLSDEARAVIWLHDVEGYTHKEIGELMGKTASFSKSQLARGYQRLAEWARANDPGIGSRTDADCARDREDEQEHVRYRIDANIDAPCAP